MKVQIFAQNSVHIMKIAIYLFGAKIADRVLQMVENIADLLT